MMPSWLDELQSLHNQRKHLKKNLRYLEEQASKVSKVSVNTYSEIEDLKARLRNVEARILMLQGQHDGEIEQQQGISKLESYTLPEIETGSDNEASSPLPQAETARAAATAEAAPNRSPAADPFSRIVLMIGVLVGIGVLVMGIGLILNTLRNQNSPAAPTQAAQPGDTELVIYQGYYHIGDAAIEQFHHAAPQPNPFSARFEIAQPGNAYTLSLTAIHVDPSIEQSPTVLSINGQFVAYLNSYFQTENLDPKKVLVKVDPAMIKKGSNEIKIEGQATKLEYRAPNLDDFEFWGLTIEISQ